MMLTDYFTNSCTIQQHNLCNEYHLKNSEIISRFMKSSLALKFSNISTNRQVTGTDTGDE